MINVYDLSRKKTAVLNQAHDATETTILNGVGQMVFTIPANDVKVEMCKARHYVRDGDDGELYRIIDYSADEDDVSEVQYSCEHVIAALADTLMFGDTVVTGSTAACIRSVLSRQSNWVLDECDFNFQYEYAWTSENLLAALFSIATPFTEAYQWVFNTAAYPWRVSLKRLDLNSVPQFYVFSGLNFLRSQKKSQTGSVCTKLYAQGYGEGVNQLGIESVNNGVPYILADQSAIDEYGIVEGHFVDRSIEDSTILLQRTRAVLAEAQRPTIVYDVQSADLYEMTKNEYQRAAVGKVIEFGADKYRTYITQTIKNHDIPGNISLKLATKPTDLATMLADLADRQRIESTYSQGATQLWSNTTADNASPTDGHEHAIWIPDDALIINKVMVRIKLTKFRTYSKNTSSGGGSTQTSSNGGGGSTSSSAGGSVTSASTGNSGSDSLGSIDYRNTSAASLATEYREMYLQGIRTGGSSVGLTQAQTGATNGHFHYYLQPSGTHYHNVGEANLTHYHLIPSHSHSFYLPAHSHTFNMPAHSHSVSIPSHGHSVNIPSHTHQIEYGIFTASETPTSAMVYVGNTYAFSMDTSFEGDITRYLLGQDGKIPRGRFIELRIVPDKLARVTVSSAPQAFIQSKSGGNY